MTSTTDQQATAAFGQARDGLKDVLAELRDLAHGIHPALLSQGGLAAALEDGGRAASAAGPGDRSAPRGPAPRWRRPLYFVACEALANVVKHAGRTSATITVSIGESQLDMEIADDGIGRRHRAPGPPGAWPTSSTASARSTGRSASTARPVRGPVSRWESHAVSDRRGLRAVPQQPGAAARGVRRPGHRQRAIRRGTARGHQGPARRTRSSSTSGCRHPSPTKASAPHTSYAAFTRRSAFSSCPPTRKPDTPASCSRRCAPASATC